MRDKILRGKEDEDTPIILVGGKCDLSSRRDALQDLEYRKKYYHWEKGERIPVAPPTYEEGKALAKEWNCPFFEASAKGNINNDEIFFEAYREWKHWKNNNTSEIVDRSNISNVWMDCCTCTCCKFRDNEKNIVLEIPLLDNSYPNPCDDQYHKFNYQRSMRRNQLKLAFYKVKNVEPDRVQEPILSLKNFEINRRFSWHRFIKSLFCGMFLPIIIILQTCVFLVYTEKNDCVHFCKQIYADSFAFEKIHHSILLDLLGLVVGRYPNQDPDSAKGRAWFLRQTLAQKLQRILISILLCTTLFICYYNMSQIINKRLNVSVIESVGPLILFWILWLLLSCWIAYESKLEPSIPSTFRLRSTKLYLGERFSHVTDAHKFIRAYGWSRNKKWRLPVLETIIIIGSGLLYASIPCFSRLVIGDASTDWHRKTLFTSNGKTVELGAVIANFMLISSFMYAIEVQYNKHFHNYREWMLDLTMLLSKTTTNINDEDLEEHYIPQKGRNFSKDIFLSLTRRSNALGWLEIRSFLAAEGQLLFAEQELPTLWILLLTVSLSIFMLYHVFFVHGNSLQSILFEGAGVLCIICLVSLIRIAITGYQFESIQKLQERLLGEQRFFMRCSKKFNTQIEINNAHIQSVRQNASEQITDANSNIDLQYDEKEEEEEINIEEIKQNEAKYLRLKQNEVMNDNVMIDMWKDIHFISAQTDDIQNKSDKFGFIDNMLFIVERKDIFPRLFNVKLNSVLAKAIAGIILSGIIAVAKILL
eukprot:271268_1